MEWYLPVIWAGLIGVAVAMKPAETGSEAPQRRCQPGSVRNHSAITTIADRAEKNV